MKITRILITFTMIALLSMTFVSADSEYVSANDPLVSLSYVNDVLYPELTAQIMANIESQYVKITDLSLASAGSYTALSLGSGKTLMSDGICEIILLDGQGKVTVTSAANVKAGAGISDLTAGAVLVNNDTVPANHMLVIPKGDGRGIVFSGATNILVRGEYHIAG